MTSVLPGSRRDRGLSQTDELYIGYSDQTRSVRHVSYVPFMRGLEAVCGTPLCATAIFPAGFRNHVISCATCRSLVG